MEDTQLALSATDLQKTVLHVLNAMEVEVKNGKTLLSWGIDTNLVTLIRNYLTTGEHKSDSTPQPSDLSPNSVAHTFARIFLEMLKRVNITDDIDTYIFEVHGSQLSICVYLKQDKYTFETRAKIYSLKSQLINSIEALENLSVDLLVLRKEESTSQTEVPASAENSM